MERLLDLLLPLVVVNTHTRLASCLGVVLRRPRSLAQATTREFGKREREGGLRGFFFFFFGQFSGGPKTSDEG